MNPILKFQLSWLLICLCVLSGANAAEKINASSHNWQEFKSADGHFAIEFPTPPVARTNTQESVIGLVRNHIFESDSAIGKFSLDYSDLPGFAVTFTGNGTIYSHATGSLLQKTLGKIRSTKDIEYQGHSGKHLIYDIPQAIDKPEFDGEAYLFLIDKRLYVINAIAPAAASLPNVKHFLNSLQFD